MAVLLVELRTYKSDVIRLSPECKKHIVDFATKSVKYQTFTKLWEIW
jgi:hypothetical protein